MSEVKYDSVLVGYTDEPRCDDRGNVMSWSVRLKDHELKEIVDKYTTNRNEKGEGGNIYLTLFMAKSGKACARVFDPNSEAAREKRAAKAGQAQVESQATAPVEQTPTSVVSDDNDDLPF